MISDRVISNGLRAIVAAVCLLSGCGGSDSADSGRAMFTVVWPESTRLIPEASQSVRIEIKRNNISVATRVIPRPAGGGPASVTFQNLPVGAVTAVATAHPNADGTGVAQASGSVGFTVVAGQTTPFTLTMATTIDRIEVILPDVTLNPGQVRQLTVSGKNAANEIVLISANKLDWVSLNTVVATVDSLGRVTAKNPGSAQIRVTETESGQSAIATVEVVPQLPSPFVYVADRENHRAVRMEDMSGTNTTYFTESGIRNLRDIDVDSRGRIYLADDGSGRIIRFDADGSNVVALGGFDGPRGIGIDSSDRIYVTETTLHRIIRIDDMDGSGRTEFNTDIRGASDVFVAPDGKIYIAATESRQIVRIDDMSGAGRRELAINNLIPLSMFVDSSGRIYLPNRPGDEIIRVDDMDGNGLIRFGSTGSGQGQFFRPHHLTLDSSGRIYIADESNRRVVRMDNMTGAGWITHGSLANGFGFIPSVAVR